LRRSIKFSFKLHYIYIYI